MIIAAVLYGGYQGADMMGTISVNILNSTKDTIGLGISMLGIVGMWSGIMNIAVESGLVKKLTGAMEPALTFLFPAIPKDSPVRGDIATNMISNILGLGWAATPAGLRAMNGLKNLHSSEITDPSIATNEMCTFLVINISSLQLIPINIIAYRTEYGSVNPASIVGPGILATLVSTFVAILFCKLMLR